MSDLSVALAFIVAFFTIVILGVSGLSSWECNQYGEAAGFETNHVGVTMCMINDPDYGWLSYEERKLTRFAERTK